MKELPDEVLLEGVCPGVMISYQNGKFGYVPSGSAEEIDPSTIRLDGYPVDLVFTAYLNNEDLGRQEGCGEIAEYARRAIGNKIKELRERVDHTQPELVEQMRLVSGDQAPTNVTLSRLENGNNFPQLKTLEILTDTLNINFSYFLSLASYEFWSLYDDLPEQLPNAVLTQGVEPGALIEFKNGRFGYMPGKDIQQLSSYEIRVNDWPIAGVFVAYLNNEDLGRQKGCEEIAKLARQAVGEEMRKWRNHEGVSQPDLAQRMKQVAGDGKAPTPTTLSRLENGRNFPQFNTLKIFANAMNVSPQYFLSNCTDIFWEKLNGES